MNMIEHLIEHAKQWALSNLEQNIEHANQWAIFFLEQNVATEKTAGKCMAGKTVDVERFIKGLQPINPSYPTTIQCCHDWHALAPDKRRR